MLKIKYFALLFLIFPFLTMGQILFNTNFRDTNKNHIESQIDFYDFAFPICNQILDSSYFTPPQNGLYLKATYGHRYMSANSNKSDNHGGYDFWDEHTCNEINYNDETPIEIQCMCDGIIVEVVSGDSLALESTPEGRFVKVKCNKLSQAYQDSLYIFYRHLSSLGEKAQLAYDLETQQSISKGETIGTMGASGTTNNVHLHLSAETKDTTNTIFIHTSRLFNPQEYPHILGVLDTAKVELLANWSDSALFRVVWPYNQSVNQFEFINEDQNWVFNKEEAYETGASNRDAIDCIEGINVFAYQFNGKSTAASRYSNEAPNMPALYPASPNRDDSPEIYNYSHFGLDSINSISYVYDFIIKNISPSHSADSFIVLLSDVWGYTIESRMYEFNNENETENISPSVYPILFSISPNPAENKLCINGLENEPKQIEIYDLNGKFLHQAKVHPDQNEIDISNLEKGVYLLRILNLKAVTTIRFIKL